MATWNYRVELDPQGELPDEWVWERLRLRRNSLLRDSDYLALPDNPQNTQAMREYRQALRDLPSTTTDPRNAAWPVMPI